MRIGLCETTLFGQLKGRTLDEIWKPFQLIGFSENQTESSLIGQHIL